MQKCYFDIAQSQYECPFLKKMFECCCCSLIPYSCAFQHGLNLKHFPFIKNNPLTRSFFKKYSIPFAIHLWVSASDIFLISECLVLSSLAPFLCSMCILYPLLWNLLNWFEDVERLACLGVVAPEDLELPAMTVCEVSQTRVNVLSSLTVYCCFCLCETVLSAVLGWGWTLGLCVTSLWERKVPLSIGICSCKVLWAAWWGSWGWMLGAQLTPAPALEAQL